MNILFPHEKIRDTQGSFIDDVLNSIKEKKHLIAHVPTGVGKTAGILAPLLSYAIKNSLTIFFLTPRHTQHAIVIETLRLIKEKHKLNLIVADFIGKQGMCLQENVEKLENSEFHNFCNHLVENKTCEYYEKFHDNFDKANFMQNIKKKIPLNVQDLIENARLSKLCPYEATAELAKEANVIIADYLHILQPQIREILFKKINKDLNNCILIFDEAHNLDKRARELLSISLSTVLLELSIKEANRFGLPIIDDLLNLKNILLSFNFNEEILIKKEDLTKNINDIVELIKNLDFASEIVLGEQKRSFIHNISKFLTSWLGNDEGFIRILNKEVKGKDVIIKIDYKCLDPSLVTKPIIENSKLVICMSGTLIPTEMYKDLLGFGTNTKLVEYESIFPKENQINLIVPNATTKFTLRNDIMFNRIARECSEIVNNVPGNSIIFFPSYEILNKIYNEFGTLCNKKMFIEESSFSKSEKEEIIQKFKDNYEKGSVLLGVSAASFGEGIDLIGDLLKCVIIVGLPLAKLDLETKELIKYYDKKYGKGWDYAYIYPAIIKAMQNAGRCIRSENDKGVIVFLDERYSWPKYKNCFPKDKNFITTKLPLTIIKEFFR